jgi:hypothetical protein
MPKQKTVYQCDFCKKVKAKLETIKKHENICLNNPNGFNCYMCEHAYLGTAYVDDCYGGTHEYKDKPICNEQEDFINNNIAETCERYKRSEYIYHARELKNGEIVPIKELSYDADRFFGL